ncbi:MAG: class II aldolase/adducin family protein [Proteobacteria bacterium]|nr:class II aldolase/adducin family protein [Pseudomonadota bacterium]
MADKAQEAKKLLVHLGKLMFDRHLTDSAGGNISIRIEDKVLMTPTYAGGHYHWDLNTDQILTLDLEGNRLGGKGEVSREAKVHLALLGEFYPEGNAVVHSHARNVLVFCAADKPMPPVLYATRKYGIIPQCVDAASGTDNLASNIADSVRHQSNWVKNRAAPVMAPRHGLFVLGTSLLDAFDATERIDTNAYCILAGSHLGITPVGGGAPINLKYE